MLSSIASDCAKAIHMFSICRLEYRKDSIQNIEWFMRRTIYKIGSDGLIKKNVSWRYDKAYSTAHFNSALFVKKYNYIVVSDIRKWTLTYPKL